MISAVIVVAVFALLVIVHELGHFITAKLFGVKVEEFGLGYPPRALILGTWGGTEYTVNWLPFGGFVRLFGESDTHPRAQGSLSSLRRYKQAVVLVAGVTANILLAWLLMTIAFTQGMVMSVDQAQEGERVRLVVTDVVDGSPAAAARLATGDEIISMIDKKGASAKLTPEGVVNFVKTRAGAELYVTFVQRGATTTAIVRPANAVVPGSEARPAIGVGLSQVAVRTLPLFQAMYTAVPATYYMLVDVVAGVWHIFQTAVGSALNIQEMVGPVGLVTIVGDAAQNGFSQLVRLAAFISVNLAVINLLPIPALDGGRLFILAIEAILRRPAPKLYVNIINTVGISLIILLMVSVTYNDILRLLV